MPEKYNDIFTLLRVLWKEPYSTKGGNLHNSLLWVQIQVQLLLELEANLLVQNVIELEYEPSRK